MRFPRTLSRTSDAFSVSHHVASLLLISQLAAVFVAGEHAHLTVGDTVIDDLGCLDAHSLLDLEAFVGLHRALQHHD